MREKPTKGRYQNRISTKAVAYSLRYEDMKLRMGDDWDSFSYRYRGHARIPLPHLSFSRSLMKLLYYLQT